ncbi:hypothetical protein QYF36_014144 [Acer negundo]|nr:hypothetical protein QYF36_014144 [Acer negundo]
MNTSLCYLVYFQSLFLVILFASTTTCITTDLAHENKTDEVALRAFKSKIDTQGVLNSWNDSGHFCQWKGITCSRRHKRVTILDLSLRGLHGSLSPYIGNLSFLRELILSDNNIQDHRWIGHDDIDLLEGSVMHGLCKKSVLT